jgi:hypothetical protein
MAEGPSPWWPTDKDVYIWVDKIIRRLCVGNEQQVLVTGMARILLRVTNCSSLAKEKYEAQVLYTFKIFDVKSFPYIIQFSEKKTTDS